MNQAIKMISCCKNHEHNLITNFMMILGKKNSTMESGILIIKDFKGIDPIKSKNLFIM